MSAVETVSNPLWTTVLWTAAAAVSGSFIVATYARSTKISEFRQAWIIALREAISAYLASVYEHHARLLELSELLETEGRGAKIREQCDPLRHRARTLLHRIRLSVNPKPNRHRKQDEALLDSLGLLLTDDRTLPLTAFEARVDQAEMLAREILKREWQVTKRPIYSWLQDRQFSLWSRYRH